MATQDLKQRHKDEPTTTTTTDRDDIHTKRAKKLAMARRGLKSLAIAMLVPVSLTTMTAYLFCSSSHGAAAGLAKPPFWLPPLWAFHLASLSSSCLLGLSAWLVWAEGGFHRQPLALPLYVATLVLSMLWGPLVLGHGVTRAGLGVCGALFWALFGCSRCFGRVNPIAGDLVKPCLAWVVFLGLMNYKLM